VNSFSVHELRTAVTKLRADHEVEPSQIPAILSKILERKPFMAEYTYRDALQDWLFDSSYNHAESSNSCLKLEERPTRDNDNPEIHYGVVASGNQVIKHGKTRDQLAQKLGNVCFEMEPYGGSTILSAWSSGESVTTMIPTRTSNDKSTQLQPRQLMPRNYSLLCLVDTSQRRILKDPERDIDIISLLP
jgi:hypothetical protein